MDKMNGVFDKGFTGIIEDSNGYKMPDYLDKLVQQEAGFNPKKVIAPKIAYDDVGFARANELKSDNSRETKVSNRFTKEKNIKNAADTKIKSIDRRFQELLYDGKKPREIEKTLFKEFARDEVNKYLEASIKLTLHKYSQLGFEHLEDSEANIVAQAKKDFQVKRSTAKDILNKFAKLSYVTNAVLKDFNDAMKAERPLTVIATFLWSLDSIKRANMRSAASDYASASRSLEQKTSNIREPKNNDTHNKVIASTRKIASMLAEYKADICAGKTSATIQKRMAKEYGLDLLKVLLDKHASDLTRTEKFYTRQSFKTNFNKLEETAHDVSENTRVPQYDATKLYNYACQMMTNGSTLDEVKAAFKKGYDGKVIAHFMANNKSRLERRYGQLGYIFIDANIYGNCEEMKKAYAEMTHVGKKLVHAVKSCGNCSGCSSNRGGRCHKVGGLMLSNNPIVCSAKAAKKVFDKAATFAPATYIESFVGSLTSENNRAVVAKFALGLKSAVFNDGRDFKKRAAADTRVQEDFVEASDAMMNTDPFNKGVNSKIIDSIL